MKLADIIALAKQGYKVSDIKELIALGESTDEKGENSQPDQTAESQEEPAAEAPAEAPAEEAEKAEIDTQEPDYKALYEAEKKKRQADNRRRNAAPEDKPVTDDQFLSNIAAMY